MTCRRKAAPGGTAARALLPLLALLALTPAAARGQDWPYDHNGSVMRLEVSGDRVTIRYETPRAALRGSGVHPGTVLFSGQYVEAGQVEGMAWIFSSRCGPIDHFVHGALLPGQDFELAGAAPVRDAACRIVDNTTTGANARLRFTALAPPAPSPDPPRTAPLAAGACIRAEGGAQLRTGPGWHYGAIAVLPDRLCGGSLRTPDTGGWTGVDFQGWVGWLPVSALE